MVDLLSRRRLILGLGSALAARGLPVRAQSGQLHRIAFLSGATKADSASLFESFLEGLRELGYREGRNVLVDARWANYSAEQAAKLVGEIAALRPDGALLFSDALMYGQRKALAAFFLKHRIPSAAGWSVFPESGHLVSYGPERHAALRRLAYYVDRIIKGARPADLPIELPTVIEMVVNRRTAAAMSLAVSPAILARADRVID